MISKSPTEFRAWNEEMAHKYSPGRYHEQSHPLIRWIERQRVHAIVRLLRLKGNETVLEVGCGAGNVLAALPLTTRPVGIDLSAVLTVESRERLASRNGMITQADAEYIPFPDNTFSRIICTEVLEHVQHPEAVLAEIARVALPDAIIVVSIPNEKIISFLRRVTGGVRALWRTGGSDEWHLHEFDLAYLRQRANGCLELCEVAPIISWALPIRYVVRLALPSTH